ncbi:MAG: DUF58 domain-containing protein [Bdellovibrionales bacterium]|nr:DUF58 domain-containing protein [Bdellovibrionales bacterium]
MNEEILKKVKKIELSTRRLMNDIMGGDYRSRFKGQGVQFSEHRVYSPGDDIRHLDWKVTARSKEPLVKQFEEERELNVLIIADFSGSEEFGSRLTTKRQIVTELSAMIAYAASNSGDKIGMLLLSNKIQKVVPLKKGRNHVLRIVHDLVSTQTEPGGTALKEALEETLRTLKQSGIVFVISDFIAEGYEGSLKRLGKKHDLVVVPIEDPSEFTMPTIGTMYLEDPETGAISVIDSTRGSFQKEWNTQSQEFKTKLKQNLISSKAEVLAVNTHEDYAERLVRFLRKRKKAK